VSEASFSSVLRLAGSMEEVFHRGPACILMTRFIKLSNQGYMGVAGLNYPFGFSN